MRKLVEKQAEQGLTMHFASDDPMLGMQLVKALRQGLRVTEVPVSYRRRIGVSKITGTLRGTILAGYKILWTVLRYSWAPR